MYNWPLPRTELLKSRWAPGPKLSIQILPLPQSFGIQIEITSQLGSVFYAEKTAAQGLPGVCLLPSGLLRGRRWGMTGRTQKRDGKGAFPRSLVCVQSPFPDQLLSAIRFDEIPSVLIMSTDFLPNLP